MFELRGKVFPHVPTPIPEEQNRPDVYAYIKFKKVAFARKAFEHIPSLGLLLNAPSLKAIYSDHLKRGYIVGDNYEFEAPEEMTNVVYIGCNMGVNIPNEARLQEVFNVFGPIKWVSRYQQPNDLRSYAFVEFERLVTNTSHILNKLTNEIFFSCVG